MKARKLGKTVVGQEITLGGLWQSWMDLNDFDISQAQACLKTLGIIGGNNLPQWLNDHSTVSLLTTMTSKIIEKTVFLFDFLRFWGVRGQQISTINLKGC